MGEPIEKEEPVMEQQEETPPQGGLMSRGTTDGV